MAFFDRPLAQLFIAICCLCLLFACRTTHVSSLPLVIQENENIKLYSLDNVPQSFTSILQGQKATVLFFWATKCPCVKRYQERMNVLFEKYKSKGVAFFAISSNSDDDIATLSAELKKRQVKMPVLKDQGGVLAKRLGATGTPAAVLLDQQGNIRYRGWIDNERREGEKNRLPYLEQALLEMLEGQEMSLPQTPMFGCPITRSLSGF